jgi:hypothetical protein
VIGRAESFTSVERVVFEPTGSWSGEARKEQILGPGTEPAQSTTRGRVAVAVLALRSVTDTCTEYAPAARGMQGSWLRLRSGQEAEEGGSREYWYVRGPFPPVAFTVRTVRFPIVTGSGEASTAQMWGPATGPRHPIRRERTERDARPTWSVTVTVTE